MHKMITRRMSPTREITLRMVTNIPTGKVFRSEHTLADDGEHDFLMTDIKVEGYVTAIQLSTGMVFHFPLNHAAEVADRAVMSMFY